MAVPSSIALPERYRLERRIATGGMASVWAAHDDLLDRQVAVKVLSPQFEADDAARVRFVREARAAARISDCGHVVTIYDIGEHAGRTFIVMERFEGGSLADRLRRGAPVPRPTALRWLREAAIALDCAHEHGIVHRDVKPGNLLLDTDGRLAVADFGIARVADETQLTLTGELVGTAAYFSPEQALGNQATAASDRYALAVVAFELLCGERPYRGEHVTAQARQHVEAPIPRASERAPGLPPAVDDVFMRGLAKDPADRPPTAASLVDGLERALDDVAPATEPPTQPIAAPAPPRFERRTAPPPPPPPPPSPARRSRRLLPVGLVAAAALAGGGAAAVIATRGDSGSGGGTQQTTSGDRGTGSSQRNASSRTQGSATTRGTTTSPSTATTPATDSRTPSELNDAGYALIQSGRYEEAVPLLQRAVQGYRDAGETGDLPYAFALYNLAYALSRSGHPDQAIPLLQERLRFSNQRGVVRKELRRAQQESGTGGAGDG
jgi:eukaryotic-like serine/threonine-protein kinase